MTRVDHYLPVSTAEMARAAGAARAFDPDLVSYDVARLLVSRPRMLMSLCRVLMGGMRMLLGFLVVALFVVIRRRVMCLGGVLVMLSCFAMCFVCHKDPLFSG